MLQLMLEAIVELKIYLQKGMLYLEN